MTWLLGLLASFAFLGARRRESNTGLFGIVLILILLGVGYEALKVHLL